MKGTFRNDTREEIVRLQSALVRANEDLERKNQEILLLGQKSQGEDSGDGMVARRDAMIDATLSAVCELPDPPSLDELSHI